MKVVWSATLTVGEASQDETTILGYTPGRNVDIGDLDDTEFSDRGVDYAILTLIHQQTGSVNQVVLEVDAPACRMILSLRWTASGTRYRTRTGARVA